MMRDEDHIGSEYKSLANVSRILGHLHCLNIVSNPSDFPPPQPHFRPLFIPKAT